jgi:hypothetical protein
MEVLDRAFELGGLHVPALRAERAAGVSPDVGEYPNRPLAAA